MSEGLEKRHRVERCWWGGRQDLGLGFECRTEAGPGRQLQCWVLAAQPGLRVRSRFEMSVDLMCSVWALERMSLCGRQSVTKDRATRIRKKVPKLGCTHCCCENNSGKVRGVWPGGGASVEQVECVRVCLLPALLNKHCVIQASS